MASSDKSPPWGNFCTLAYSLLLVGSPGYNDLCSVNEDGSSSV